MAARKAIAQTYQDAVLSGLAVPTLRGAFAVCRKEGSIVLNGNWFVDKIAVLLPRKRDVRLCIVDHRDAVTDIDDTAVLEKAGAVFSMRELLWVNSPSLNARAVDAETGAPVGFDLIFRTQTLTLTESVVFDDAELANSTHQLQQVLLSWKPLVRSANLLKINRFGAEQKRWFMLENNVDLSWWVVVVCRLRACVRACIIGVCGDGVPSAACAWARTCANVAVMFCYDSDEHRLLLRPYVLSPCVSLCPCCCFRVLLQH
jgi:hypothetical protein